MKTILNSKLRGVVAAGALCLASVAASAHTIAAVSAAGNFTLGAAGLVTLPGMTTPLFFNAAGQRFIVTFAAECAVNAPAGNSVAWTDVDVVVLNIFGGVVSTLSPTVGNLGAFCSSNGTAGFDGWSANSVTAIGGAGLPAGNYRVQVRARSNNGALGSWYGERSLIVAR